MARKEFSYRGKSLEELKSLSHTELARLLTARARRKIKRGFNDKEKKLIKDLENGNNVKTHCRDMIILPAFVGKNIMIHNGKEFVAVLIQNEMVGDYLGEYSLTRKRVAHSNPGVGATRSSAHSSTR